LIPFVNNEMSRTSRTHEAMNIAKVLKGIDQEDQGVDGDNRSYAVGYGGVYWIHTSGDKDQYLAFVNVEMNLRVP
jgi:hypothetical protein